MDIHVMVTFPQLSFVDELSQRIGQMSEALDALTAQVAETKGVTESAVVLLDGLAAKIDALIAAGVPPGSLEALSSDLKADTAALADALTRDQRP